MQAHQKITTVMAIKFAIVATKILIHVVIGAEFEISKRVRNP